MTIRPADRLLAWPTVLLSLMVAGCPGLLPGTDRAFDAATAESVATPFDVGTTTPPPDAPAVIPPAMDAGTDRGGAVVIPPAMDAGTDRGGPVVVLADVGAPADSPTPDLGVLVDRVLPVDRGAPDVGVPDAGRDPPGCGGHGNGGEPCCLNNRCNAGYLCRRPGGSSAAVCLRCGGNREICCQDDGCDADRDCQDGYCR